MKHIKPVALIVGLALYGCQHTDTTQTSVKVEQTTVSSKDKKQIEELIRRVYKWQETQRSPYDALITDSLNNRYIGFNTDLLTQHFQQLKSSDFFSTGFIDNYSNIYTTLDTKLRNKELEWFVGELPPFGNDTNPWCNCQDAPDNYWRTMTIHKLSCEHNEVTFTWTWGDDFEYQAKAVKQQGKWKIAYLEGFKNNE